MKKILFFGLFAVSFSSFGQLPIGLNCGDQASPEWDYGLNKIYNFCPEVLLGLNTNNPRVSLDVNGVTHTNNISIGSLDPVTVGLKLFHLKANYPQANRATQVLFLVENHQRALFQISNNGIVRAREIIIDLTTPWPDYVFTPGYKLKTLREIEEFINKHGHLPDVPSAEEVAEEGISLGEMDRILLEKIEELTLHLIEQQKIIEAQQKRIEVLETKK